MTHRVSPTEKLRAEIADVFAGADGHHDLGASLEDVARLGARLLLQTALEEEVAELLGRDRYQRRAGNEDARDGSRNGYSDLTVKTTAGPLTLRRPKLGGVTEAFASRLLGKGVTKTNALESLVIAGWVCGACPPATSKQPSKRRWGRRPRCSSRLSAGCARPSRPSSRRSRPATCRDSSWSTCTSTAPTSRCIPAPAPIRSSPRRRLSGCG